VAQAGVEIPTDVGDSRLVPMFAGSRASIDAMGWREWTGVGERRWKTAPNEHVQPPKTLWDWLQLLIVPAILFAVTFAWSAAQTKSDNGREDRRSQDATLQAYLDEMSGLMLDKKLLISKQGDPVRAVARTVTLTALRRLDAERKGEVARFLVEAKLLEEPAVIDSLHADLEGADLENAELDGAVFQGARLRGANLKGAFLEGANLEGADLENADLGGADLASASLRGAILRGASLRDADLDSATLEGADLENANLENANLENAILRDAKLTGAKGLPAGNR
jgi:hypothetical protein